MKKYLEILRASELFNDVKNENLEALLGCLGAFVKSFDKNTTVLSEGDNVGYIGIVLSGKAQIEQTDYFGNRTIVANVEPSELFGESFACADVKQMPVDVVAKENTDIMFVDCRRITEPCCNACDFHRRMIYNLMKIVATKNLMFHQKIQITSKRSTREKLMTFLLFQAKKNNSNSFDIAFDRQELADYLEVDRSGLSAEISKLRREGVIECRKNRFVIK